MRKDKYIIHSMNFPTANVDATALQKLMASIIYRPLNTRWKHGIQPTGKWNIGQQKLKRTAQTEFSTRRMEKWQWALRSRPYWWPNFRSFRYPKAVSNVVKVELTVDG